MFTFSQIPKGRLSQMYTHGHNSYGQTAEVILTIPEHSYQKVIVDKDGRFQDFPGIIKGHWAHYLDSKFDFDAGLIRYQAHFQVHDQGYRCFWEIQPDGRYWGDDSGFGADNSLEIVLYADMDYRGVFKGPFQIYTVDIEYWFECSHFTNLTNNILRNMVKQIRAEAEISFLKKHPRTSFVHAQLPLDHKKLGVRLRLADSMISDNIMEIFVSDQGSEKCSNYIHHRFIKVQEAKDYLFGDKLPEELRLCLTQDTLTR